MGIEYSERLGAVFRGLESMQSPFLLEGLLTMVGALTQSVGSVTCAFSIMPCS